MMTCWIKFGGLLGSNLGFGKGAILAGRIWLLVMGRMVGRKKVGLGAYWSFKSAVF